LIFILAPVITGCLRLVITAVIPGAARSASLAGLSSSTGGFNIGVLYCLSITSVFFPFYGPYPWRAGHPIINNVHAGRSAFHAQMISYEIALGFPLSGRLIDSRVPMSMLDHMSMRSAQCGLSCCSPLGAVIFTIADPLRGQPRAFDIA